MYEIFFSCPPWIQILATPMVLAHKQMDKANFTHSKYQDHTSKKFSKLAISNYLRWHIPHFPFILVFKTKALPGSSLVDEPPTRDIYEYEEKGANDQKKFKIVNLPQLSKDHS